MFDERESKKLVGQFLYEEKGEFSEIRTVLIFGKNTSTYKFAFCHALLQQKPTDSLKYEALKEDMLNAFIDRYKIEKKQFTGGESNFSRSLDQYLEGKANRGQMEAEADKVMFKYVVDAFQNVGGSSLDKDHLLFEHDKKSKRIVLTDRLNLLLDRPEDKLELLKECENRWSVVEEAWKNNISPNLIYDSNSESFVEAENLKRVAVRSALAALLPYQKGRCFYCQRKLDLSLGKDKESFPDVDHFIPWSFFRTLPGYNPNGVWNLVIACKSCNRGENGKFNRIPAKKYFEKLLQRNLYFAIEHRHSLKTSIYISLNVKDSTSIIAEMVKLNKLFPLTRWNPLAIFNNEGS